LIKICVVTATRAEYSAFLPLLKKIKRDKEFDLKLAVTGAHLSQEFGSTYKEIEKDGFKIDKKIDMLLSGDSGVCISKSMGLALISFADYFSENKFDILLIAGDRYELIPICSAAINELIPIAHIGGGDITEGMIDDSIRHAVSKFSYLHFTSTEEYRKRVIQLGESPERVFVCGELSLENIINKKLFNKKELEKNINFSLKEKYILVTFHPVTLEKDNNLKNFKEILKVLEFLKIRVIFTESNADKNGRKINKLIEEFTKKNSENYTVFKSMGQENYLSAMKYSALVLGNSSSGIYEAPSLCIPSVNIGDRQKGRICADSVVNCECNFSSILQAVKKCLNKEFLEKVKNVKNPYFCNDSSQKILDIIKYFIKNNKIDLKKKFYNVEVGEINQ